MSGHKGKTGRGDPSPRHAEIARDLRATIADGTWPVGTVLPTEMELCSRYGVSRHTIRIAVADLAESGLVTRRKRLGTVVQANHPVRSYRQIVASVDDLVQYGADHVRSVRRTGLIKAGPMLAQALDCATGTQWFCVSSLRFDRITGQVPLGLTDVYIDPTHAEVGELARRSPSRLISSFVAERTGQRIARIKQTVMAALIDQRLSSILKADAGTPALRIVRHYLDDDGRLFVGSVSVHPAERFEVSSTLVRTSSG